MQFFAVRSRRLALVLAIISFPLVSRAESFARPASVGFYPLWENTGYVEPHRHFYLGTNGSVLGLQDWGQVVVQPLNFLYRTPNFGFKFRLPWQSSWSTALQVSTFYLLEMASRATLSPQYSSRIDNPDYRVLLVPVSLSASRRFSDAITVHQTLTFLALFSSGSLQDAVTPAYSIVGEFEALSRHSLLFHLAELGFWNHDHLMVGASYRWAGERMEFRAGYFYRVSAGAAQSAPLVSLGVYL